MSNHDSENIGLAGHHYLSSACFHAKHGQCHTQCMFCDAHCCCTCHTNDTSEEVLKRYAEAIILRALQATQEVRFRVKDSDKIPPEIWGYKFK